jgi:hypothetical protein
MFSKLKLINSLSRLYLVSKSVSRRFLERVECFKFRLSRDAKFITDDTIKLMSEVVPHHKSTHDRPQPLRADHSSMHQIPTTLHQPKSPQLDGLQELCYHGCVLF